MLQSCSTQSRRLLQVQRYLQDYAASDGGHLPTADLAHSRELYAAAAAAGEADAGSDEHVSRCACSHLDGVFLLGGNICQHMHHSMRLLRVVYCKQSLQIRPTCRLDTYLEAAADLARQQWTQFGVASMGGGLAVLVATLAAQLAACWALMRPPPSHPSELIAPSAAATGDRAGSSDNAAAQGSNGGITGRQGVSTGGAAPQAAWLWGVEGAAWFAVLGHAAALFSNSFILAQVQNPCHTCMDPPCMLLTT